MLVFDSLAARSCARVKQKEHIDVMGKCWGVDVFGRELRGCVGMLVWSSLIWKTVLVVRFLSPDTHDLFCTPNPTPAMTDDMPSLVVRLCRNHTAHRSLLLLLRFPYQLTSTRSTAMANERSALLPSKSSRTTNQRATSLRRSRTSAVVLGIIVLFVSTAAFLRWRRAVVPDYIDHDFGVGFDLTYPYGYVPAF